MPRPILAGASSALVTIALLTGSSAAADVTATDGQTRITLATPIVAPATGACTQVPVTYLVASDVATATPVIVDAHQVLVARGSQLVPGQGSAALNVCTGNLSGRTAPYTLQLRITYAEADRAPVVVGATSTFGFAPRTVACRKTTRPSKGRVRVFRQSVCPRGWTPVRR